MSFKAVYLIHSMERVDVCRVSVFYVYFFWT